MAKVAGFDGNEKTNAFRRKRMATFMAVLDRLIAQKGAVQVLDIGGTTGYWRTLAPLWQDRPVTFTIVNLGVEASDDGPFRIRPGNARSLPEYADNSFDMVHSNSVIEHVGQFNEMMEMAGEIRRLAPSYFVQTPNMWFPVEPHFKLPIMHWLPEQAQAWCLLLRKGKYLPVGSTYADATRMAQRTNLLSRRQFQALFPDARMEAERFAGLVKSWMAIRDG